MKGVLKDGGAFYPFWGKSFNSSKGLDPLGQKYASQVIYSTLLSGITSQTNRIRYYGYYCWLLNEYDRIREHRYSRKDQMRFIRRSELIMAILMKFSNPDVINIPGSDTASTMISESEADIFDIAAHTDDRLSEKSYYQSSFGAFGDLYVGSLMKLGLVDAMETDKQTVYVISEAENRIDGKELALAFKENINDHAENIFIDAIENKKLKKGQLSTLYESFNLLAIPLKSYEWKCYVNLLQGPDDPKNIEDNTYYRSETMETILKKTPTELITKEVILDDYFDQGSSLHDESSFNTTKGWYLYRLNEYWQYSCGTLFWAVLDLLSIYGVKTRSELIGEFSKEVLSVSNISNGSKISDLNTYISKEQLNQNQAEIARLLKDGQEIKAASLSFEILLALMSIPVDELDNMHEALKSSGTSIDGGIVHQIKKVNDSGILDKNIEDLLYWFVDRHILKRHWSVALKKMGTSNKSTNMFDLEDEELLYKNNFPPEFTSPRIESLFRILKDLQLLKPVNSRSYLVDENARML